jgi:hypothetical protein
MTDIEENKYEESYVDVRIYGIPAGDFDYFKEIIKVFEGDRVRAFRALLDSYNREQLLGQLITKIQTLEQRIEDLEHLKKFDGLKTFGGKLE